GGPRGGADGAEGREAAVRAGGAGVAAPPGRQGGRIGDAVAPSWDAIAPVQCLHLVVQSLGRGAPLGHAGVHLRPAFRPFERSGLRSGAGCRIVCSADLPLRRMRRVLPIGLLLLGAAALAQSPGSDTVYAY